MPDFVDIHTHAPEGSGIRIYSRRLGVEKAVPARPYSEGIHPWDAASVGDTVPLIELLLTDDVAAAGEIGLDKLHPDYPQQGEIFRMQLEVAEKRKLPVIIHCVKAFEDVMKRLAEFHTGPVIFHGYTGSTQQTQKIYESGYYISAGNISLESPKTLESLQNFPLDRLFLETDDTGISIETIYNKASQALNVPVNELVRQIYYNYNTVFPVL